MAQVCIISCYLRLEGEIVDVLNSLADRLLRLDVVTLFVVTSKSAELRHPVLVVPYLPAGAGEVCEAVGDGLPGGDDHLIDQHRVWRPHLVDSGKAATGIERCKRAYDELFRRLRPSIALTWDAFSPQSILLQEVAHRHGVPALAIERGLLPKTLMVDLGGSGVFSELSYSLVLDGLIDRLEPDLSRLDESRQIYKSQLWEKYPVGAEGGCARSLLDAKRVGCFCVGVFTQFVPAGVYPRGNGRSDIAFPFWEDYGKAIEDVLGSVAACAPQPKFFLRDHPINRRERFFEINGGEYDLVHCNEGPALELLVNTDLDVFIGNTTLLYEALLHGKRVLQVGRSSVERFDVTYSPSNFDGSLKRAVEAAVAGHGFDAMQRRIDKVLWMLSEFYLFGYDGAPVRQTIDDLAARLAVRASWRGQGGASFDEAAGTALSIQSEYFRLDGSSAARAGVAVGVSSSGARAENASRNADRQLRFSHEFSRWFNAVRELGERGSKVVLYGDGSVGKAVRALIPDVIVATVDRASTRQPEESEGFSLDAVYSPDALSRLEYDFVVVSVLGREDEVVKELSVKYSVPKAKILVFRIGEELSLPMPACVPDVKPSAS